MARQNINVGVNENDGTGDKLRDAMKKVNDNFIELYTVTLASGNLGIANGTITTTNVNSPNLILKPISNGNVDIAYGLNVNTEKSINGLTVFNNGGNIALFKVDPATESAQLDGNLTVDKITVIQNSYLEGNVKLGSIPSNVIDVVGKTQGNFIPTIDNEYRLGSPTERFSYGFFSNVNTLVTNATAATITSANVNVLRVSGDSFLGDLLIRDNMISNGVANKDIEFRPDGTGNVLISTKLIVGVGSTPMVNPVLQATGNADNFTQIGVQNKSGGKFACSDIVVFNNAGSDFFNFVDIGQNNTHWDGSLQYAYFDYGSNADNWQVNDFVFQYDIDGSSILARGQIDEIVTNPLNTNEIRVRICGVFTGTTGIFEQGSICGDVYNENRNNSATPKEHLIETIISTGVSIYKLGTHSLNDSTARAAFAPTIALAPDSVEVKVNGETKVPGVDFTIQFDQILFYTIPSIGTTITIRQFPDANYPFTAGQSGDSYVYNNGSKLTLGTMTGHDLLFHVNGCRYTAEAGRIKGPTKNWIIGSGVTSMHGFDDTGEKLQVHGDIKATGSINVGSAVINGNLTVNGTTTTVNSTEASIADKTITIASGASSPEMTDGAGIIIDSSFASLLYDYTNDGWLINRDVLCSSTISCTDLISNISDAAPFTVASTLQVQNLNAEFAGKVVDAEQPNITGLGTLTGLTVEGNVNVTGNINLNGSSISNIIVPYIIDGGGDPITTGSKKYLGPMNFGGTITAASVIADQVGSIAIQIRKCTYDQFDAGVTYPSASDKITGATPITLSNAVKAKDTSLSDWTVEFAEGDIFEFIVDSASDVTWVEVVLAVAKG